MGKEKLEIHQKQKERLSFIDFCADYLGVISRTDLMTRFGISDGAASKDLSLYIKSAPDNLKYDFKSKSHYTTNQFKSLFDFPVTQALKALSTGFGDTLEETRLPLIDSKTAIELNRPNPEIVAQVTRAIHLKKTAEIKYHSLTSGKTKRVIAPFAIINSGLRWHVRAFDRKTNEFKDFTFARMQQAIRLDEEQKDSESSKHDVLWNEEITLELTPHPDNIEEKYSIQMDYGMVKGKIAVKAKKAVAGYLLRHWNVDCTDDHSLGGAHYQLWLKNSRDIKEDVEVSKD